MKTIIFIASAIDSLTFAVLFWCGAYFLWLGNVFEACALICTAVFWQRAWKADVINAYRNKSAQRKDTPND